MLSTIGSVTCLRVVMRLVILVASTALADPPTPPQKPTRWEFIGTYEVGVGAGRGSVNVVIDLDSIRRDGNIVSAYVGRDFTQVGGHWEPDLGWAVYSYKIDCKYHTFNTLWTQHSGGMFGNPHDEWVKIDGFSDVELAERRVCMNSAPKKGG